MPSISQGLSSSWFFKDRVIIREGAYYVNEQGATFLLGTIGFPLFLLGRITGTAILRKLKAHKVLWLYAIANVILCSIVMFRLGWFSVTAVFVSFFFMSIMFPTIFALGIHGLGVQAKKASGYIVMAIMGGAIMPKLMGHLGDVYNMSISFLVPLCCFAIISVYGFMWSKLSKVDNKINPIAVQGR